MAEDITTFKPLKGHRFKCNQTGVVVPAGKTDAYRRQRFGLSHPKPKQKEPSRYQPAFIQRSQSSLREAYIGPDGDVCCPLCSHWHHRVYVSVGEMVCRGCWGRFIASPARVRSTPNLLRAQIDNDGDLICPHPGCRRWNFGVSPGERVCDSCYQKFIAFR